VLLAQESPTTVGAAAVRQAYAGFFRAINLDIKFHVAGVVELTHERTFARTTSTGTIKINVTGGTIPEANQELVIFKKGGDGAWTIARYASSVINPPPKP
jgi:ketosteroid isomerase-like protein